jgi:hypothetical protein
MNFVVRLIRHADLPPKLKDFTFRLMVTATPSDLVSEEAAEDYESLEIIRMGPASQAMYPLLDVPHDPSDPSHRLGTLTA